MNLTINAINFSSNANPIKLKSNYGSFLGKRELKSDSFERTNPKIKGWDKIYDEIGYSEEMVPKEKLRQYMVQYYPHLYPSQAYFAAAYNLNSEQVERYKEYINCANESGFTPDFREYPAALRNWNSTTDSYAYLASLKEAGEMIDYLRSDEKDENGKLKSGLTRNLGHAEAVGFVDYFYSKNMPADIDTINYYIYLRDKAGSDTAHALYPRSIYAQKAFYQAINRDDNIKEYVRYRKTVK